MVVIHLNLKGEESEVEALGFIYLFSWSQLFLFLSNEADKKQIYLFHVFHLQ